MAKPHGKNLIGVESGKQCQHWYNWTKSRYRIQQFNPWQGPRVKTRPGVAYFTATSLLN